SRLEALANGQLTSIELPIDDIAFELPPNASINYPAVETLARVIAENGIRTPVEVYFKIGDPTPYACDGFELRAAVDFARAKQWVTDSLPLMVTTRLENSRHEAKGQLFARLLENGGKKLSPLERADYIRELVDLNHPVEGIAKQLQTKKQYILKLLLLSQATPATRQLIDERRLKATTVMNTIAKYGAIKSEQLLAASVKQAEGQSQKATGKFVESFISRQNLLEGADIQPGNASSDDFAVNSPPASPQPLEQSDLTTRSPSHYLVAWSEPARAKAEKNVLIENLANTDFSKLQFEVLSELVNTLKKFQILPRDEEMER
ncbi:MAG: hypothetical protein AAGA40_18120, partial [Cyanobacteria bacterium P01_E01_bin.45]